MEWPDWKDGSIVARPFVGFLIRIGIKIRDRIKKNRILRQKELIEKTIEEALEKYAKTLEEYGKNDNN